MSAQHLSYSEGKKEVRRGLILLGVVTLAEVFIALLGKGYIISGFELPWYIMYLGMIGLSLYKAYFIVFYFMHMKYEVPGLVRSVLLPTLLLVWAIIAFFQEGNAWKKAKMEAGAVHIDLPADFGDHHDTKQHEDDGHHEQGGH